MISAAVIVILLAAVASLGSWLFSQWVVARQRSSVLALSVGGVGLVLLLGAAAVAIISAPRWWESFVPRFLQPATQASPSVGSTKGVAESVPLLVSLIRADWPATACVNPVDSDAGLGTWFLDNDCEGVVAVVLAWCEQPEAACEANAPQAWRYEPSGVVMISANQRPSPLRLGDQGPLIAATYALKAPDAARRHVVFLACYITAPAVHAVLGGEVAGTDVPDSQQHIRLQTALSADECYSRVARWSRVGQERGMPPDALLRRGVDG